MPNTYGGAISQGINQGLQNVSAISGLKSQMQKAGQEQELYDIQMKEYQRGQEPADWGKVGDFLDAGEYGKNYAQSYAGALGMDPAKMTRREMKDFGQIFLKDQKAAHDLLTLRRRHYGEKVKEYEGKPDKKDELELFKQKFGEATLLDKEYRAAEGYKKTAQTMQEIAKMTDEQLTANGYVPAIRTIAQSGDMETFGEIMKELVKAQVKPPTATEFEKYEKLTPEQKKEYDKFKGAGKTAADKLTPKGFDQKGRAVYAGPEGNLVYEDKTPYKGGQLKGITEPWAPIPPEWEKKEQLNTVRNEIKDVTGQIDAVRKQMTWGLAENGPAEILRLEKHLKDLKAEESRLTGKKETPKTETAIPKQESTNVIRYDAKGNRITK